MNGIQEIQTELRHIRKNMILSIALQRHPFMIKPCLICTVKDCYSVSHFSQGPADTAVEEVHSILRQIVARTIESEDCKGLAQFTLLKREIATTAAQSLEKMKDDARKMVQTMVEMESSYLTAEVFKEILSQSNNPEGGDLLRTLSGRPVSFSFSP